ncbi:hypothetical protein ACFWNH_29250 [Rhodococcus qingshengii]|uniref:hypothetical protein n=1 Tax=Rhodococcus qingshengii TaxID=334542 RepID=UPI00366693C9
MITDLDNPNSLVYVMQDAAMQGWKYSAMVMVASVVVTAIVFAIFMPWSRGTSLVDLSLEERDDDGLPWVQVPASPLGSVRADSLDN